MFEDVNSSLKFRNDDCNLEFVGLNWKTFSFNEEFLRYTIKFNQKSKYQKKQIKSLKKEIITGKNLKSQKAFVRLVFESNMNLWKNTQFKNECLVSS